MSDSLYNKNQTTKHRWWMPPENLDRTQKTLLVTVCLLSILSGYLGVLLSQINTYFREDFGVSTNSIASLSAVVRVAAIFALFIVWLADRYGRRKVVLWCAFCSCILSTCTAFAPTLFWLGILQLLSRSGSTALGILLAIMIVEEMPAGSRAFGISLLSLSSALGAGFVVGLFPLAGWQPWGWRIVFALSILGIVPIVLLRKWLPETRRFTHYEHSKNSTKIMSVEVQETFSKKRLAIISSAWFCTGMFATPTVFFLNDFLRLHHNFSDGHLVLFQTITNVPGVIGVILGGKLADRYGRKKVGSVAAFGGGLCTLLTFLSSGSFLWIFSLLSSVIGGALVPALGVYGGELFPTSVRGKANGWITIIGVSGSVLGLLFMGYMVDHVGSYGNATSVLFLGPIALACLFLFALPETTKHELEELNPQDTSPDAIDVWNV